MLQKSGPTYREPQFRLCPILPHPRKLATAFCTQQVPAGLCQDHLGLVQSLLTYRAFCILEEFRNKLYKCRIFPAKKEKKDKKYRRQTKQLLNSWLTIFIDMAWITHTSQHISQVTQRKRLCFPSKIIFICHYLGVKLLP